MDKLVIKIEKISCQCDRFTFNCGGLATQEDLLCNICRNGRCNMSVESSDIPMPHYMIGIDPVFKKVGDHLD